MEHTINETSSLVSRADYVEANACAHPHEAKLYRTRRVWLGANQMCCSERTANTTGTLDTLINNTKLIVSVLHQTMYARLHM